MPAVSKRFISLSSFAFFVAFLLVSWCAPVQGAIKPVGEVILANGTFLAIQSDRSSRSLTRGSEFYQGDRLWTGPRTKAQIRFSDGAIMTLRADTEFRVDEYEFDSKNASRNKSLFTLIKGGFRTITGLVSRLKPENYRVKTSYAIIGVRGTTYETVVDNALYVAAWQGTVSVQNDAGETLLGFGQDTNFARISGANRRPSTLLEAPPQLLESVDPDLKEFVVQGRRLGFEIIPEEANLSQIGFATFGGPNAQGPLGGAASDGSNGSPLFFDPSARSALRQGSASTTFLASPAPGVSWGKWEGGPVEFETLAGGVQSVASPVFWITMAPPPTSALTGSRVYNSAGPNVQSQVSGSGGVAGVHEVSSFLATLDFTSGNLTGGVMVVQDGTNTWTTLFSGTVNGPRFNAVLGGGSVVNSAAAVGTIVGGVTRSGADPKGAIGGVFDFQESGVPITHVEGTFLAQ